MNFSEKILNWYDQNKRDLPWRHTKDPYKIWISEIIMQQTQISRGTEYYLRFTEHFPSVFDLADADEQEILLQWQGLGYYSRARNLHKTAQIITENYNGIFPDTYDRIIKLKGIGDYTAAMILSISFNKKYAAVDGNVLRFMSRLKGISKPINKNDGTSLVKKTVQNLISAESPGHFNQAIIEYGAMLCKKIKPECGNCMFNDTCFAYLNDTVSEFPVKVKSGDKQTEYFYYFVCIDNKTKQLVIKKREEGIWLNMYEFPSVISLRRISEKNAINKFNNNYKFLTNKTLRTVSEEIKHVLTHKKLYVKFFIMEGEIIKQTEDRNDKYKIVKFSELKNHPFPNVIRKFINEMFF
jgi:A/G-specific adenine glycosylase